MMHELETKTNNSCLTLSKTINEADDDFLRRQQMGPDSLHPSNTLSKVRNERMKNWRAKEESEEDEEKETYENISSIEEITINDLVNEWIDCMLNKGIKGLNDEFIKLCTKTKPSPNNYTIFTANQNSGRNRYQNVVCLNNTRVKLHNHPSGNDYIHANYVSTPFSERRFICTQAPLDYTIYDFWFMIIQNKVKYIVMLTNFIENGYMKSTPYFPSDANRTENYNGVIVKCLTCERRTDFECEVWERSLFIELPGMKSTVVTHFHWTDWPDHGLPNSYSCPLQLLEVVRMSATPIVLHCSAGIGRTGCLVLMESVLEKLVYKQICSDMGFLLTQLRRQRANLVQNNIQYLYVHRVLLHFFILTRPIKKMDEVSEFITEYNHFVFGGRRRRKKLLHRSHKVL
ncbi:unnamed protein product [Cercopithifilaria johnstoni]|uniref:Protein tyrosine phosphatase n=1 Tax=Cercopithifilaria johnstoni TaxID=2874296 RepID=A0A8J2PXP0_9BILA|nr:unnamed protein product [Cercopithifilaria johnstoni]